MACARGPKVKLGIAGTANINGRGEPGFSVMAAVDFHWKPAC